MTRDATHEHLAAALADAEAGWAFGGFGAAAEFRRGDDEAFAPLGAGRLGLRTARGAIELVLPSAMRPVAYETPVGDAWSHAVALCLPEAALPRAPRTVLTEVGPDAGALDPAQGDARLFDLGLGLRQVAACLRTRDPGALARLRAGLSRPVADPDGLVLPELRAGAAGLVFAGPLGRIEVEAAALHARPPGPRAYVVPRILRLRRTHVATAPIPAGLVPCGHLHPPHPCRDAEGRPIPFDHGRHAAFQGTLARWGDPRAFALKAHLLGAGPRPDLPPDRWTRAVERVVRVQAARIASDG